MEEQPPDRRVGEQALERGWCIRLPGIHTDEDPVAAGSSVVGECCARPGQAMVAWPDRRETVTPAAAASRSIASTVRSASPNKEAPA